jgi:hypothetical protein
MHRLIPLLALLVPLAAAPAATAKEVSHVEVCGPSGCRVSDGDGLERFVQGGRIAPAPPVAERAHWFRVTVTITWDGVGGRQGHDRYHLRYYPDAGLTRFPDRIWVPVSRAGVAQFAALMEDVAPYGPAPPPDPPEPTAAAPANDAGSLVSLPAVIAIAGVVAATLVLILRRSARAPTVRPPYSRS